MMPFIPSPLLEAVNGLLATLTFWMFGFGIAHLARTYGEARRRFLGRFGWWRAALYIYDHNKPEIALVTIIAGLCARSMLLWYYRFVQDHQVLGLEFVNRHGALLILWTTAIMVIGVTCWIRVISPLRN